MRRKLYYISEKKSYPRDVQQFLEEVTTELLSSYDLRLALQKVVQHSVPYLADICSIVLKTKGDILELAAHDFEGEENDLFIKANVLFEKIDPATLSYGPSVIFQTGQAELLAPPQYKKSLVPFGSQLYEILYEKLKLRSYIGVPLKARGKVIGAMTFATKGSRAYTKKDLFLAQVIAQRISLVLDNVRLYDEAYEKAQRAIAMRDDFMSIASHELRTPITSVKMYAQYLKGLYKRSSEKNLLDYLDRMDMQMDKMTTLIRDLLDVSRIEHGKFLLNFSAFFLDDEVKKEVQAVQAITEKHQIRIEGKVGKPVRGDKVRISQVLINLLTNAVKYSPEASIIIVKLAAHKDNAFVSVQDFGIGIYKEYLNKLFNPFFRAEGAEKEAKTTPGLGIGLYVSSEIIKKHGSRINVESVKGKGSTFSFTLPYA